MNCIVLWTKHGFNTVTQKLKNNLSNGNISAFYGPKNSVTIVGYQVSFRFLEQRWKLWKKCGKCTKGVLYLHDNAPIQNRLHWKELIFFFIFLIIRRILFIYSQSSKSIWRLKKFQQITEPLRLYCWNMINPYLLGSYNSFIHGFQSQYWFGSYNG